MVSTGDAQLNMKVRSSVVLRMALMGYQTAVAKEISIQVHT